MKREKGKRDIYGLIQGHVAQELLAQGLFLSGAFNTGSFTTGAFTTGALNTGAFITWAFITGGYLIPIGVAVITLVKYSSCCSDMFQLISFIKPCSEETHTIYTH